MAGGGQGSGGMGGGQVAGGAQPGGGMMFGGAQPGGGMGGGMNMPTPSYGVQMPGGDMGGMGGDQKMYAGGSDTFNESAGVRYAEPAIGSPGVDMSGMGGPYHFGGGYGGGMGGFGGGYGMGSPFGGFGMGMPGMGYGGGMGGFGMGSPFGGYGGGMGGYGGGMGGYGGGMGGFSRGFGSPFRGGFGGMGGFDGGMSKVGYGGGMGGGMGDGMGGVGQVYRTPEQQKADDAYNASPQAAYERQRNAAANQMFTREVAPGVMQAGGNPQAIRDFLNTYDQQYGGGMGGFSRGMGSPFRGGMGGIQDRMYREQPGRDMPVQEGGRSPLAFLPGESGRYGGINPGGGFKGSAPLSQQPTMYRPMYRPVLMPAPETATSDVITPRRTGGIVSLLKHK